ncbi:helix-turn-helix domain containing protein [Tistrella bauzanensis]|jgi:AcrR family transcriptional regulator|uniref:Helix-turn-helix domain-containing protein n=1 Tax=Tistrella arctica TaxID=3133430 RepID=A0ABU9YGF3_9PROT
MAQDRLPDRGDGGMPAAAAEDATRDRLKAAARRLFSRHGIDAVSVRNIVTEAGMRNGASLHYYFGAKDALVRELVVEAAMRSDRARNLRLDAMEAAGGPRRLSDVVRLMIEVETIGTGDPDEVKGLPIGFGHMRFVMAVQVNHRALFLDAVGDRWVSSYMRCIDHLRRLLAHLPAPVVSQRLAFMALFMNSSLAAREAAFEADPSGGGLWGKPYALDNLISAICGALDAPQIPELETRGPD